MRLLVLLLVACPSYPPTAQMAAAPDTVAALHRLFAAKRRRFLYVAGGTVVSGATIIGLIGSAAKPHSGGGSGYGSLNSGPYFDFTSFEQASAGILTGLLVGVEALFYAKYNRDAEDAEQQAVSKAQTHQLPSTLKRHLKTQYFYE